MVAPLWRGHGGADRNADPRARRRRGQSFTRDHYISGGLTLIDHGQGVSTAYLHQSKRLVDARRGGRGAAGASA